LRAATDAEPQVAGKPAPGLLTDAAARGDFRAPLVVGDRLDTDIEGANAARLPSLMVLSGVNSARDAVYARPGRRPTYLGHDLRSLHCDGERLAVGPQPGWRVEAAGGAITVAAARNDDGEDDGDDNGEDDGLSVVRAVASAVWGADGAEPRIEAADDRAREALRRWSLVRDD
ncbi:HAD hydrolase-like protein, partial [Mycobacterium sp. E2462]|uniref:HAD hydrolase-like protein n=1 Tax=Mycobacterium sp. E2462 TaxID=1834133 RepID=UPI000AFB51DD